MEKFTHQLCLGGLVLAALIGCQGSTPEDEEATREPAEAMVEEAFEGGNTGDLDSAPEASTESEGQKQDDSP